MSILNKIPILTSKEEKLFLLKLKKENDALSAHYLIIAHLRFVLRVARSYMGYGLSLADLMQEGTIGLMKSIKKYDLTRGIRLVSFSVYWIKAEIHEYIFRNWGIVKIATTKKQRKLFFSGIDKVNTNELCAIGKKILGSDCSLDILEKEQLPYSNFEGTMYLRLPNIPSVFFENKKDLFKLKLIMNEYTRNLDFKRKFILFNRWFVENKMTLMQISNIFNISTERVRQIEKDIIKNITYLFKYIL
jgi:RNA polymerase sigma-32 factor